MLISIIVIAISIAIVLGNIGAYIYKRIKGLPVGDCEMCKKGTKKLLKEYRKMYQIEGNK